MKKKEKGSLSVEAALLMPMVLSVAMFFLFFFQVMLVHEKVDVGLWETAKEISKYSYIYDAELGDKKAENEYSSMAGDFVLGLLTGERMKSYTSDSFIEGTCVKGGAAGIKYQTKALSNKASADICILAEYDMEFPLFSFVVPPIHFIQQVKTRGFVGTTKIGLDEKDQDDPLVYISNNNVISRVYHKNIQCTHLNLMIQTTTLDRVKQLRNQYGGKYGACSKCVKHQKLQNSATVYVTADGDCYHSTLDCGGLTRKVRQVKLSTLIGYRPCSRCG